MIDVRFSGNGADSQEAYEEEEDPIITAVRSVREDVRVTIEDGEVPASGQRAHTTAYLGLMYCIEWVVWQKTWHDAFTSVRDLWRFSNNLQQEWYKRDELASTLDDATNTLVHNPVIKGIVQRSFDRRAETIESTWLARQGVDLKDAWFARPKDGTPEERAQNRVYFRHEPTSTDYVATDFDPPQRWKPDLGGPHRAALIASLEAWLTARSALPWTSVDTESYETGERRWTDALTEALESANATADKGRRVRAAQIAEIAAAMLGTFDFFPPTLHEQRKIEHGAAVAARHVLEHFQCVSAIRPEWRKDIADSFLTVWKERTAANIEANSPGADRKRARTEGGSSTRSKAREVTGLEEMISKWPNVEHAYNVYYAAFSPALTW